MKLNLNEIKQKLIKGEDSLVDETLLASDMGSMYDYYSEESEKPPRIQEYFDSYLGFENQAFTEAYLSSLTGYNIRTEFTEDGWLRIYRS